MFPSFKEIPEFHVEERQLTIPNDLNESYCLRVEVSRDNGKGWTTAESCVPPSGKSVPLSLQTATNVNVSVCLVYRPEVCGEPVVSKIRKLTLLHMVLVLTPLLMFNISVFAFAFQNALSGALEFSEISSSSESL